MSDHFNHQTRRSVAKPKRLPLNEERYWYLQRQRKKQRKARLAGQPQMPGGAGFNKLKQPWKRTKDFNKA